MTETVQFIRTIALKLMCITGTGCASAWINKSGSLGASVTDVEPSELHDVYTLMHSLGYQMREARGSGISDRETWEVLAWGKTGSFVDPNHERLIVPFIYAENERLLMVSMNEFYTKGGGCKPESQIRADQVMSSIKQRFGKSARVTVRSYCTGIH